MCPRPEVHAGFRLLVDNRGVTPISYRGGCLVVDWGLERSLLDRFLVRGLVVALI